MQVLQYKFTQGIGKVLAEGTIDWVDGCLEMVSQFNEASLEAWLTTHNPCSSTAERFESLPLEHGKE